MIRLLELRQGRVGELTDPQGRSYRSAIAKEPVPGPVLLGPEGLAGDEVADRKNHGGPDQALLGCALESYRAWAQEGREIRVGALGENLLFEGLTETQACIGDVLQIGEARLQISQPRVPCGTLQRRLGWGDTVRHVFTVARGGFYLRVLEAAPLAPELPVQLVERPNPTWTIQRALHAQWKVKEAPEEALGLAALPQLSAQWRERLPRQAQEA